MSDTLETRVAALEAALSPSAVYVVMHDFEPRAVVRTEDEAEALVRRWLKPGLHRAIGSACWFLVPSSLTGSGGESGV